MGFIFLRKPRLIPTVFTLLVVAVTVALGIWQLERRAWKHAFIARVEQRISAEPVALPTSVSDPDLWDYRRVATSGTYLHDRETYLQLPSREGQFGYQIVTPLQRPDGSVVMVNRGWVPPKLLDRATRPESLTPGLVRLTAIARMPWSRSSIAEAVMPGSDIERKIFYEANLAELTRAVGVENAFPMFVDVIESSQSTRYPVPGQTVLRVRDQHLSYALTWFALAIASAAIFVIYHRRRELL